MAAVKLAFEEFFNKHSRDVPTRVVVHPVAAASGVNEQPYGLQETVTGILFPLCCVCEFLPFLLYIWFRKNSYFWFVFPVDRGDQSLRGVQSEFDCRCRRGRAHYGLLLRH
jgi:hypothetical protein